MQAKTNLLGLDLASLRQFIADIGEKPFRALQIMKWIHQHQVTEFAEMSNLSFALREKLQQNAVIVAPKIAKQQVASDGTIKWLFQIPGGSLIETVYIPEQTRATLCVSSQVGCALNCKFCSTARQGFNRNLTSAEIIGQLWLANSFLDESHQRISNVVFMGMGEPLLNLSAVLPALNLMRDDNAYGLARRRVTISTSGVVPGIIELGRHTDVALALSLHAPNDELRNQLIPLNKKYNLSELLPVCRNYVQSQRRGKVTIEYVMLSGVNDSLIHAKQLSKLLSKVPAKINLIPFNPFPDAPYLPSSPQVIADFMSVLKNAGYVTTVRATRGDDIDAACGQLVGKVIDRTRRSGWFAPRSVDVATM